VNVRLGDGTTRRGQVLEVDGEKAVVQVATFLWTLFLKLKTADQVLVILLLI
jgi:vacuolar-type H+-ATPase subunit B/Vma2